jgi:RNA polymerase sigma-70 factor (ECF subfamily)
MTSDALPNIDATGRYDELAQVVAALYEEYYQPICTYLYCLVDERELAHDLAQETFLQLFYTRHRLAKVENQRAWLYRIATHLALNKLKRRWCITWLPWHLVENLPHFHWHALDEEFNQRAAVEHAFAALPPNYRAPLLLYSHYGFTIREIAIALDRKESTIKVQLHRARELFQQAYAAENYVGKSAGNDAENDHA